MYAMRRVAFSAVSLLISPLIPSAAQDGPTPSRSGRRLLLEAAREIALARSAAPPAVSDSATVYVLTDTGYVATIPGTNGVACYVSRSWPGSLEPHCYDVEGAGTIMRIQMRKTELLHRGVSEAEAERQIGADLAAGRLRLPRRPAMSYMMSGAQVLISDQGRPAGRWKPHIMIYFPFLTQADLGLGGTDQRAAQVANPGTATSSILVVVREFIDPAPVSSGGPTP